MSKSAQMLSVVGKALFGDQWQGPLAKRLQIRDTRRIRQWLNGVPVPKGIWAELQEEIEERSLVLAAAGTQLAEMICNLDLEAQAKARWDSEADQLNSWTELGQDERDTLVAAERDRQQCKE